MTIYEVILIREKVTPEIVLVEASSPKVAMRKAQHYLSSASTAVWVPISVKRKAEGVPVA